MARPQPPPLQRQLRRVRRRLFWQTLLACLFWCWAGALALSAGWFLAQSFLIPSPPGWLRLAVAGSVLGSATLLGIFLGVLRTPGRLDAALLLDERFGLKERVTTSLTLEPQHQHTPAAQALLADANQRVSQLDVGTRFPVRVSWLATVAPVVAALLAVGAFYYQPPPTQAKASVEAKRSEPPANAAEIEKKLDSLKKKPAEQRREGRPPSEDLQRIEAELDQIARRPRETKEQLRERIKEMTALEDSLKQREKEATERMQSIRNQLQQMDRWANQDGNHDGPAKDLQKALAEGKLDEAKKELQKLAKKIKENQLTAKEKEQLKKQLQDLQKKLERAAQQKDKQDQLKKLHQEGKLDADTLKRELEQLKQDSQQLKDLQKLANQLGQAQQAMQNGNDKEAGSSLDDAAEQMKELDLQEQDLQDLREQLQRLQDAKDSC
jgi:uncharacterized coiled-coil DUF342 family protein